MTIEERFDMILLVGEKHRPIADIAQVVVRILGKDEVTSSSLVISCNEIPPEDRFFRGFLQLSFVKLRHITFTSVLFTLKVCYALQRFFSTLKFCFTLHHRLYLVNCI